MIMNVRPDHPDFIGPQRKRGPVAKDPTRLPDHWVKLWKPELERQLAERPYSADAPDYWDDGRVTGNVEETPEPRPDPKQKPVKRNPRPAKSDASTGRPGPQVMDPRHRVNRDDYSVNELVGESVSIRTMRKVITRTPGVEILLTQLWELHDVLITSQIEMYPVVQNERRLGKPGPATTASASLREVIVRVEDLRDLMEEDLNVTRQHGRGANRRSRAARSQAAS